MEKKPQIAFLLYANRSGSTFLASGLANARNVGVTIEGTFFARLVEKNTTILEDADVDAVLRLLIADITFGDWNIDEARLRELLMALPRSANVEDVIRVILQLYFDDDSLKYHIIKAPRLYFHVHRMRQLFSSPKFIHIVRDPRAVYASRLRSRVLRMNQSMANDPVAFARGWRRHVSGLHMEQGADFLEIRYEDLIGDHEQTMARVCGFLADPDLPAPVFKPVFSENRYYERIPQNQKHLHKHVKVNVPVHDRVEGWRKELDETDVHLLQWITRREMKRLGYEPVSVAPSARRWWRLVLRVCWWRVIATGYAVRRYAGYVCHPAYLKEAFFRNYYRYKRS
jgi:LPS sulfotransferase NodH